MSEEELAALESEWQKLIEVQESGGKLSSVAVKSMAFEDVPKLLAEIKRLRGLAKPDYELEGKIFEDHRDRVDIGTTGSRPIEDALEEIGLGNIVKVWIFKLA